MDEIRKNLEQDARQVSQHMPLEVTETSAGILMVALGEFIQKNNFTQSKVASLLDVNKTTLNRFLNGHFDIANLKQLLNKITNLINSFDARQRKAKQGFVETSTAKAIFTLIRQTESFSDEEGCIGLVVGDSGHGKSLCLREYAKANNNSVYVSLDSTMSATAMFAAIAEKLFLDSKGSLGKICRRIWERLQERHLIILLDECSSLSVSQLDKLRQVISCKGRTPFVLAGNNDLLKTVSQGKAKYGYESLDQFCSRLLCVVDLDEMAGDGGLYSAEEVRRLYEFGGIKLTGEAADIIKRICCAGGSGRLRTCSLIIRALHTVDFVQEKKVITLELVLACINELGLPVGRILPKITENNKTKYYSKMA